jgi:hypothetical protein
MNRQAYVRLAEWRSYSWLKVKAGDSLLEDRIEQDVDKELAAKDWTRVNSNGNASIFRISIHSRSAQKFRN